MGAEGTRPLCRTLLEPRASRALCWSWLLAVPGQGGLRASTGAGGGVSLTPQPSKGSNTILPPSNDSIHSS